MPIQKNDSLRNQINRHLTPETQSEFNKLSKKVSGFYCMNTDQVGHNVQILRSEHLGQRGQINEDEVYTQKCS